MSRLGAGGIRIEATTGANEAAPATADFQLVAPENATTAEFARTAYVKAHLSLEAGRLDEAAQLAGEAADVGEFLSYHRMAALHVLGEAEYALGNRAAALSAYRDALEVAEAAFPKSHLPEILGPRIRELEAR